MPRKTTAEKKERGRLYRLKHKERLNANCRAWQAANREYARQRAAEYRQIHPDQNRQRCAAWYLKHKDEYNEIRRAANAAWREANPRGDRGQHLYILERSDLPGIYKIGQSGCPTDRALRMQESHLFDVKLINSYQHMGCHESAVHIALQDYRMRSGKNSREWFEAPIEQIYETIFKIINNDLQE